MATLTRTRSPARSTSDDDNSGLLLVGALVAGGAGLYLATRKPSTVPIPTPTPTPGCGPFTGPAANLPTGLYVTYFNAQDTVGTVWWVVKGVGRWGIPSPTQLARCWGPNPTIVDASTVAGGFGNADSATNDYVGTIGYVSACTACPPGAPGA